MTKFNKIYFLLNFCFYNSNRFIISVTIKLSSMFMFMIYTRNLSNVEKLDKFLYFKEQFLVDIYILYILVHSRRCAYQAPGQHYVQTHIQSQST